MSEQSPKTLGQIGGFTQVFDQVVEALGLLEAAVFGRVWRYCQAEDEKCWASHARIGKDLGLSPRTVMRKLDELLESGYLYKEFRTGTSSIYKVRTGTYNSIPVTESHRTGDRNSHVPRTESHTKKELNKQNKRGRSGRPSRETPAAVNVFRKNTHRYPAKSWWKKLHDEIGEIEADLKVWGEVVFAWVGLGWNPTNVKGMLEFFKRGEIPGKNNKKEPKGFGAIRQHISEKVDA